VLLRKSLIILLMFAAFSGNSRHAAGAERTLELGLDECLQLARENNLNLANAAREVRKAETQVAIAEGSRLPEVEFSTTYTRMGDEAASAIPGIEVPGSQADLALSASVPLYTGGFLTASGEQALAGLNIARENYRAALGDTLLETTTSFYQILRAQQQVHIAEEALDVSREHEKDIEALLRRGIVARVDLVRSQLDVSERERDLAAAQTENFLAAERLSAILFPDEIFTVKPEGDLPEPVSLGTIEDWHEKALDLSPELRVSSMSKEIAVSGVLLAKAEGKGTLSLFGTYGTSSDEFTLDEESRYWNTGVNYTLSLYRGGRVRSNVLHEMQNLAQAENSLIATRRAVREAVTVAWSNAKLAVTQNTTAARAIASAEENLRVITLKYQQGLVPNTDVIDAQLSLTRSRLLRVRSLTNFNIYHAQLLRTAGAIEEMP
jgi:outer membrane protein